MASLFLEDLWLTWIVIVLFPILSSYFQDACSRRLYHFRYSNSLAWNAIKCCALDSGRIQCKWNVLYEIGQYLKGEKMSLGNNRRLCEAPQKGGFILSCRIIDNRLCRWPCAASKSWHSTQKDTSVQPGFCKSSEHLAKVSNMMLQGAWKDDSLVYVDEYEVPQTLS